MSDVKSGDTTLGLLDECLEKIYTTRKVALLSRARKFELRQLKKRHKFQSNSRVREPSAFNIDDADNEEYMDAKLLDDFSNSFLTPNIVAVSNSDSPSKLLKGTGFETMESQNEYFAVKQIDDNFRDEITSWINDEANLNKKKDTDALGDWADYLTDKYMCKILDPMPHSKIVTVLRKKISKIIEDIASYEIIPYNFLEITFKQDGGDDLDLNEEVIEKTIAKVSEIKNTINEETVSSPSATKTQVEKAEKKLSKDKHPPMTVVEKRDREKQKIKEQYESYMKIKSNSESNPDNKHAKDYEDLNADIRSLITSIKGKK